MAIVGPRPTIPAQVIDYTPRQHRRHEVRPGNHQGWAQVQGGWHPPGRADRGPTSTPSDHRSAALDARILLKTVWLLVTGPWARPD
jgi:lipopolysaccharide/colanic/teichoic acid biosynthesis glycosyltransferase